MPEFPNLQLPTPSSAQSFVLSSTLSGRAGVDSMNHWKEEVDQAEAAALKIEALELKAERDFDRVWAIAEAKGEPALALKTPEFDAWMTARGNSDAAWGRWYLVMEARPRDE